MDSWCFQGQRPTKKNNKDSRDFKKNKSSQNPPANASSSGTQSLLAQPEKDQNSHFCQREPHRQGQGQNTHIISVNATTIRKDKDKNKDKKELSNIEYYSCKQKGFYANKCPEKELKNWH